MFVCDAAVAMAEEPGVQGGRSPVEGEAPVSYQEERFYRIFSATLAGGGVGKPAGPDGYTLEGKLDGAALEAALNAFLSRHRVLWSRFFERGGAVEKVLEPPRRVALRVVDLRALPPAEQLGALMSDVSKNQHSCDDLSKPAPRFAATLYQLEEHRHAVATVSSLGVFDDDSWAIFWRELAADYERAEKGLPLETRPHRVQYGDYARWQREWHQSPELEGRVAFLRSHLQRSRAISSAVAPDLPRGPVDEARQRNFYAPFKQSGMFVKVSPEVTAGLRQLVGAFGGTLEAATFGAFAAALGRRAPHVAVRTTYSTRPATRGVDDVVGFFSNFAYVQLERAEGVTFRELIAQAHRELVQARSVPELQLIPFVFPDVDERFRTLFVHYFDVELVQQFALAGLKVEPLPFGDFRSLFYWPMHWQDWSGGAFELADGGLGLRLLCNSALWSESTAKSIADDFVRVLSSGAQSPDAPIPPVR